MSKMQNEKIKMQNRNYSFSDVKNSPFAFWISIFYLFTSRHCLFVSISFIYGN